MKNIFKPKGLISLIFLCFVVCICSSCTSSTPEYRGPAINPIKDAQTADVQLDFVELHNFVIDHLKNDYTPFFYIKEGEFDISGDNEKKEIVLSFNCIEKTTEQDAALFVVWVTKLIGNGAADQYTKYKPSTNETFGEIFNDYTLVIDGKLEGKKFINKTIKPGEEMPYDARYVKDIN